MGLGLLGLLELSIHAKYTRCKYEKMFQTKSTDILLFYSFLITFATLHYFFYYNRHGSFKLFHYASPSLRCLSTPLSLSSAKNELFFFFTGSTGRRETTFLSPSFQPLQTFKRSFCDQIPNSPKKYFSPPLPPAPGTHLPL